MSRQFALAICCFVVFACSPTANNLEVVREFERHKNDGNVESALDLFSDTPSLQFGPLGTITGLSEIRGILEYDLAINTHLRFEGCEAAALEVTCRAIETNDWLKLVEIESITYDENKFIFTSDGRIQSVAATISTESGRLLGAAMARFDAWATTNYPIEYAELFSEKGAFVYSHENAEKVLALLRQWRTD